MALTTCPDCGGAMSDAASICVHCGRPRTAGGTSPVPAVALVASGTTANAKPLQENESSATLFPFFPVAKHKFIVLSICTFGIYELYWCYQNWKRIKSLSGEKLSPFWRAFFAPLWGFSLFRRVRKRAELENVAVGWAPDSLALLYLMLSILWRLPDPWWLICLAKFLPMIMVVQTANEVNQRSRSIEYDNASYSRANVATIVVGGLFLALVVLGTVLPK